MKRFSDTYFNIKKCKSHTIILTILLMTTLFSTTGAFAFKEVPFFVRERANIVRIKEPVTYGIPFGEEDNITDESTLGVFTGDGQEVAAQFRVLSRYNGPVTDTTKPIRTVLVDFQVDQIGAAQQLTYYLKDSGSGTVAGSELISQNTSHILIDTGMLTAKISKTDFKLFDEVKLGDETIISSNPTDGIVVVDTNGIEYGSGPPSQVEIEENGPLRAVVKVTGKFQNTNDDPLVPDLGDNGLSYTVRFKIFRNASYIKVDYTLENENLGWSSTASDPVHNVWIRSNFIRTTLNGLSAEKTATFSGYSDNFSNGNYRLLQTEDSNDSTQAYNWNYIIENNNIQVSSGDKYDSCLDLKDTSSGNGLMVASRWFWQNHPKGLEAVNNEVRFHILPDVGVAHRILGGIWKTTELIYYFHDSSDSSFDNELATLKKRLVLKASDEYYASTGFFSSMVPQDIVTDYRFPAGEQLQKAIDAQEKELLSKYNLTYSDTGAGHTLFSLRDNRMILLDTDKYGTWYGWLEFGDFVRGNGYGYSATHYSWPYISLKAFIRFDDWDAFELGEELVSHAADISILHDPHATESAHRKLHGSHRYESDALLSYQDTHSNGRIGNVRSGSHFWNRGIILQYLLTGDRRYYDAAQHSIDHLETVYIDSFQCRPDASNPSACSDYDVLRAKGRAVHGLVSFYKITGNSQHLENAWNIFKYGVLGYKKSYTHESTTYTYYGPLAADDKLQYSALQSSINVEGSIELYEIFASLGHQDRADEVALFLEQNAIFVREIIYKSWIGPDCGTYGTGANDGQYYPYGQEKLWNPGDVWNDNDICHKCGQFNNYYALYLADLFAFQFNQTGEMEWLDLARSAFKDFYFYPLSVGYFDIAFDPLTVSGFSYLGYAWAKFGQRLKKGVYYLRTEWRESRKNIPALSDALGALQVVAGVTPAGGIPSTGDVDGDSKIGLAEVIYVLQRKVAN